MRSKNSNSEELDRRKCQPSRYPPVATAPPHIHRWNKRQLKIRFNGSCTAHLIRRKNNKSINISINAFNKYFSSVGTWDNGTVPECRNVNLSSILENVNIDEGNVLSSINKLKCSLSAGPDNLPPLLFKKLKYCISKPLALLYAQLLSVSYVPYDWLHATIVPVFKKGAAGNTSNYRPISLTCVPSKILERVLAQNIYTHLSVNNMNE